MPRETGSNQRNAYILTVDIDPRDQPPIAIDVPHLDRRVFTECHHRGELLRALAEVLAPLRAIDPSSRTRTERPSRMTEIVSPSVTPTTLPAKRSWEEARITAAEVGDDGRCSTGADAMQRWEPVDGRFCTRHNASRLSASGISILAAPQGPARVAVVFLAGAGDVDLLRLRERSTDADPNRMAARISRPHRAAAPTPLEAAAPGSVRVTSLTRLADRPNCKRRNFTIPTRKPAVNRFAYRLAVARNLALAKDISTQLALSY